MTVSAAQWGHFMQLNASIHMIERSADRIGIAQYVLVTFALDQPPFVLTL